MLPEQQQKIQDDRALLDLIAARSVRMPNASLLPDFTPGAGYLNTGFTLEAICALGVLETHPAIMRYEAFTKYLQRVYPERGSKPEGSRRYMMSLTGNVSRARRALTPGLVAAYDARQSARDRGVPEDELPHVGIPRGRNGQALRAAIARPGPRPAQSWRDQALQDLRVLIELKHPIPYSRTPTQTRRRKDDYAFESVPIPDQYHPPRACRGKHYDGARCRHCMVGGKRHTARPMALGQMTEEQSAPVLPRILRNGDKQ